MICKAAALDIGFDAPQQLCDLGLGKLAVQVFRRLRLGHVFPVCVELGQDAAVAELVERMGVLEDVADDDESAVGVLVRAPARHQQDGPVHIIYGYIDNGLAAENAESRVLEALDLANAMGFLPCPCLQPFLRNLPECLFPASRSLASARFSPFLALESSSRAFTRASASPISGKEPKTNFTLLPPCLKRSSHFLAALPLWDLVIRR